jgi:hypothetical protein
MTNKLHSLHLFCAVALSLSGHFVAAQQTDYCKNLATQVLTDPNPLDILRGNVINPVNDPSCFVQANLANPTNLNNAAVKAAVNAITPVRTSLWNAYQNFSPTQQQGSSLSSSGSTNAVSKPSGQTSLVEEFGGANVTRGTSSSTVQWSPGTMLANLALTGVDYLCLTKTKDPTTGETKGVPEHCISSGLLQGLEPLIFKITANTSSGTPSMTGTAATPGSTTPAQEVTVNSKGTSGPSFAGLTVQYSFFSRNGKAVKSLTSNAKTALPAGNDAATLNTSSNLTQYKDELLAAWQTDHALDACDAYQIWRPAARKRLEADVPGATASQVDKLKADIEDEYTKLLTAMVPSPSCQVALGSFRTFLASVLEAKVYEDFVAVQSSMQPGSFKPELSFEYDLNTPQNKPSYSSAKGTVNWQFGKRTANAPSPATTCPPDPGSDLSSDSMQDRKRKQQQRQQHIDCTVPQNYVKGQADTLTLAANSTDKTKQAAAQSKSQAQDTAQPGSLTLTGTADIYNSEPPSSVPSGSHLRDIQAGAEFAWVLSPFGKKSALGNFLGSVTTAFAYSYEDQTSPAILTGPALSDFTDLPSSTTAAFAKRGVIHLGQVRLGFGTGKNLTYPLAFTYSNRTELITHPTWGLQFGISYNLTSLFNSSGTTKSGSGN